MTTRAKLSIHVTVLAKLVSGDVPCAYAAHVKARGGYDRVAGDFDQFTWRRKHDAAVKRRLAELQEQGYVVSTERGNWFRESATRETDLSGCPDLVARKGDVELVEDVKTGAPHDFHVVQVQLYLAVRARRLALSGVRSFGRVSYAAGSAIDVPLASVDTEFKTRIGALLAVIASDASPAANPSYAVCRFCDIASCAFRMDAPVEDDLILGPGLFE